jgi:hypothetical protein
MLLTFLGWTEAAGADLGIHRLHVMAIGAYLAAAFLVLLSTLWRPVARPAVPVIAYVVHEATLQLALGDVHALDAHYGVMAATGGFVLVNGLLAALGVPGWRPLAWIGGGLMAFLGVMSVTLLSRSRGASGMLRRELPGARPS